MDDVSGSADLIQPDNSEYIQSDTLGAVPGAKSGVYDFRIDELCFVKYFGV